MRSSSIAASLRVSLLVSLGLLPLACAGAVDGAKTKPACTSPQVDAGSGLVSCAEGYSYRSKDSSCSAGSSSDTKPRVPASELVSCQGDASACDAYQYGYCFQPPPSEFGPVIGQMSYCQSGCGADADCGAGSVCRCEGQGPGKCFPDSCQSDADCEPGYHCASTPEGCGSSAFSCQTARDKCFGTEDCVGKGADQFCLVQEDGHRECGSGSVCGRPFLVDAAARVASITARGDWLAPRLAGPRLDHLSVAERAALAQHWTKLGQMEHASIAAFARFSLQLLALGAPPELVEACTQALADETAHTKLCFGLASAYAGRAIGPGPLDVTRSLDVTSLSDIVDLVILEGCFGETNAALEAREAAEAASDPVVVAAYSQIARDEERHAELAFRFVRWALERDLAAVAPRVRAALSQQPHGFAKRGVAGPCLAALLQERAPAAESPASA